MVLRHLLGVLGLCWLGGAMPLAPLGPTEVPPLEGRCTDVAGVLSKREVAQLQRLLRRYEQQSGHQFAVLLVPTLQNDTPEGFAVRVFEDWKLGKTGRDDGLLMLLVTDASQRDIRIEVGYGLEGAIPDAVAHRIIDEVILPALRRGKLAAGISAGLHALMKAAGGGEGAARDEPPEEEGRGSPWQLLLIPFLGIWPLLFGRRRRGGGRWGGGGFGGFGGGFGGGLGGGGGGGGGDTFSGGGGRSGGGGASGKW